MTTNQRGEAAGIPCFIPDEADSWPALSKALATAGQGWRDMRLETSAPDEDRVEPIDPEDVLEICGSAPPPPPHRSKPRRLATTRVGEPHRVALSANDEARDRAFTTPTPAVDDSHALRRQRGVLVAWLVLLSCANVYLLLTRESSIESTACASVETVDATEHALLLPRSDASSLARP